MFKDFRFTVPCVFFNSGVKATISFTDVSIICIGKTDRCFYTRIKEHARDSKSEIFEHITSCELFQHIKSILELYPDDQTNLSQTCILPEFIFNNSKIIDRSDHWSLLLFKEALAIRRFKPELNHGTKAFKDLIIFN